MRSSSVFIFLSLFAASHCLAMGQRIPAPSESKLFKSGHVFKMGNSVVAVSWEDAEQTIQWAANTKCKSKAAERISTWKYGSEGVSTTPGNCKIIEHKKYCTGGKVQHWYAVAANFRCR